MTIALSTASRSKPRRLALSADLSPGIARALLAAVVVASLAIGILSTRSETSAMAVSEAGSDLTRLLRFMAALKGVMALGAMAAVLWRLGSTITVSRFAAYAAACAAMMAGPCLIWAMAHVGLGAFLLHGGLLAAVVLLWRDPACVARLKLAVHARSKGRPRVSLTSATDEY